MMLLWSSSCSSNLNTFEACTDRTSLMLWNTTWWYSTSNALAHVELRAVLPRHLQRHAHRLVAVGRAVDADEEAAALERPVVAHDEDVLLDAADRARHHAAQLAERLPAHAVRADRHQVVAPARAAGQLLVLISSSSAIDPAVRPRSARLPAPWRRRRTCRRCWGRSRSGSAAGPRPDSPRAPSLRS